VPDLVARVPHRSAPQSALLLHSQVPMTPGRWFGKIGGPAAVLHLLLVAGLLPDAARARRSCAE
jgi:hypothetical protein